MGNRGSRGRQFPTKGTLVVTARGGRSNPDPLVHKSSGYAASRTGENVAAVCGASCRAEAHVSVQSRVRMCPKCEAK